MADSYREYLQAHADEYDPLKLLGHVREDIKRMAMRFMHIFGSEGMAHGKSVAVRL